MAESGKMANIRLAGFKYFRKRLLGAAFQELADIERSALVNLQTIGGWASAGTLCSHLSV